jgi:hypothetical protein
MREATFIIKLIKDIVMKKIILLLFACLLFSGVKQISAQNYVPFPDSNAIWNNRFWNQSVTEYTRLGLMGDTVINSVPYHKLYQLNDSVLSITNAVYYGAMREQGKKIYFRYYNCQYEFLLYDFTKNVGDTIYNIFCEDNLFSCDSINDTAVITSIDSILIESNYRKVFHFESSFSTPVWIEGIGSTSGLINPLVPAVTCICSWDLVCFKQNNEEVYLNPNFNSCFPPTVGINENIGSLFYEINISPNPASGKITIVSPEDQPLNLSVYNIVGELILHRALYNSTEEINISSLAKGVYIINVSAKDWVGQRKLVKE